MKGYWEVITNGKLATLVFIILPAFLLLVTLFCLILQYWKLAAIFGIAATINTAIIYIGLSKLARKYLGGSH